MNTVVHMRKQAVTSTPATQATPATRAGGSDLDLCLKLAAHDDPTMQSSLARRVDLRQPVSKIESRLRCGIDPLQALAAARPDPRASNMSTQKPMRGVAADKALRPVWVSHPHRPRTWLMAWVRPALFDVVQQLEQLWKIAAIRRGNQLFFGLLQRVSELRALGCVIVSRWVENPRDEAAHHVVEYELYSEVSTSPPPAGDMVLDFRSELIRLVALPETRDAVLDQIDRQNQRRRDRAETRLNKTLIVSAIASPDASAVAPNP